MRYDDFTIAKMMISKIKSKSMDYHLWLHTKFWDDWSKQQKEELFCKCSFEPEEIPVLAVVFDRASWSIFSSRAIHYANDGITARIAAVELKGADFNSFKGYRKKIETINIPSKDGNFHKAAFETGKASMTPIYALFTLQNLC